MSADRGRVLVVDDDAAIRRSLERGLRLGGFTVDLADGGRPALAVARTRPPDVIVLDISMPDLNGIEVCRTLRGDDNDVPVLMLSALDETADRIAGLQAGGDDYLVKPFALQELVLRLEALLRRRPPRDTDTVRVGGLLMDPAARRVTLDGLPVDLTRREFELLHVLARNSRPRTQQGPTPRPRMGIRLRRAHRRGGHLRQLPAPQTGDPESRADHPHRTGRGLRPAGRPGGEQR